MVSNKNEQPRENPADFLGVIKIQYNSEKSEVIRILAEYSK